MPSVTFLLNDGERRTVEAAPGTNVMLAAVANGAPGIVGECGGNASCATCHVLVEPEFLDRLPGPSSLESDMLDFVASGRARNSRLGCQITLTPALDGLVVRVPPTQV